MKEALELIKEFAAKAHKGQQRKYSTDPYIIHPERVMKLCAAHTDDPCIQYAALLHDVLEDTPVHLEQLRSFLRSVLDFPSAERTLGLVVELTDIYIKDRFPSWNRQLRRSKEASRMGRASAAAQTIKYADIIDNCKNILRDDPDFGPKYLRECEQLLDKMQGGDPSLYEKARAVISTEWAGTSNEKQFIHS